MSVEPLRRVVNDAVYTRTSNRSVIFTQQMVMPQTGGRTGSCTAIDVGKAERGMEGRHVSRSISSAGGCWRFDRRVPEREGLDSVAETD